MVAQAANRDPENSLVQIVVDEESPAEAFDDASADIAAVLDTASSAAPEAASSAVYLGVTQVVAPIAAAQAEQPEKTAAEPPAPHEDSAAAATLDHNDLPAVVAKAAALASYVAHAVVARNEPLV